MILGAPIGLLGLLALPAIVAIHLYRRRYRPRAATALFLYGPQPELLASGRTRQRLRQRASLWFELAAACAAVWWLVDPHWSQRDLARHVVLVLDTRRSLQARDGQASVHDRLLVEAKRMVAALDRDDRATLVLSGRHPRLLAGPAARPEVALAALETWQAAAPWHELDPALALAQELGGAGALVSVLSDRMPASLPPGVGAVTRGTPLATTGFADARWIEDQRGARVLARIVAHGGGTRARRVVLTDAAGVELARQEILASPDVPAVVRFDVQGRPPRLGLCLLDPLDAAAGARQDPYPDDDRVALLAPSPRILRIALKLTGAARVAVERALAAVGGVTIVAGDEPAHLLIDDGGPAPTPGTWQLRVTTGAAKPVLGPFLARRGHPLLTDIDCTAVAWSGGGDATRDEDVLLSAGDAVLLSERRVGRDRLITLNADLTRRGLIDHPAWPALIANLVALRRAALPGPSRANLPVGEPLAVAVPIGAVALRVTGPDGDRPSFPADQRGEVLLPGFDSAGEYRLDAIAADGKAMVDSPGEAESGWARVSALPLDPRLADLTACDSAERAAVGLGSSPVERSRSLAGHLLPLLAAVACATLAWLRFAREDGPR